MRIKEISIIILGTFFVVVISLGLLNFPDDINNQENEIFNEVLTGQSILFCYTKNGVEEINPKTLNDFESGIRRISNGTWHLVDGTKLDNCIIRNNI